MDGGWISVWENRDLLLSGLWLTITLNLLCIVTSTILGFAVAILGRLRNPVIRSIVRVYIEFFRGTPVLILIMFVFFGASYLHIAGMNPFAAAAIALTVYTSANVAESFRAGFEAVPLGQQEAGRTLGMARTDILRFVTFPQAMKVSVPPLFGIYIMLIKNSALAAVIGYPALVRQAQGIITRSYNPFEVLFVVGLIYFCINFTLSMVARKLERKLTI